MKIKFIDSDYDKPYWKPDYDFGSYVDHGCETTERSEQITESLANIMVLFAPGLWATLKWLVPSHHNWWWLAGFCILGLVAHSTYIVLAILNKDLSVTRHQQEKSSIEQGEKRLPDDH